MKDNQLKRQKGFVLPETVYRQALWAIKDFERMKGRLEELEHKIDSNFSAGCNDQPSKTNRISDLTGEKAVEIAVISSKVKIIKDSLDVIPEKYREGIFRKLTLGGEFGDEYHLNTWKKWQQIYIFEVAMRLQLY